MSATRIDEIVDGLAALGGAIGTDPFKVSSVWGAGSGKVADPLRPGQTVLAGVPPDDPAPYSWWILPPKPSSTWAYGDATSIDIQWLIEGRLYFDRADLANATRILIGFLNPLAKAFLAANPNAPTLSDVCAAQEIRNAGLLGTPAAAWLSVTFWVREAGMNPND
ncbi:MAG TPA: hypothetical protein VMH41_16745 [Mycobacteriales bacterium]|nr:hypothetical protein [Mycobacteriales bacterium]